MPSRISGALLRCSITTNAPSSANAIAASPSVRRRAPAEVLRLDDRVHEHDQAGGHRDRARQVDAALAVRRPGLGHVADREQRRGDADRDVDEEDPLPAEQVGQHAAEQQAERAAARRDRAPDAERLRPVLALRERRRDDRQRGGGDERAAESLQPARRDEPGVRRGEAVEQRREREDRDAHQEQPAAPEQVARAPAEQQEAAEHQRVAVDHPLQVRGGEPQVGLDRGQRDVHHRRVEDDHELREADDHEHEPAVGLARRRRLYVVVGTLGSDAGHTDLRGGGERGAAGRTLSTARAANADDAARLRRVTAAVVKLVYTRRSGRRGGNPVEVRVLSAASSCGRPLLACTAVPAAIV